MFDQFDFTDHAFTTEPVVATSKTEEVNAWRLQRLTQAWGQICNTWRQLGGSPELDLLSLAELPITDSREGGWSPCQRQLLDFELQPELIEFLYRWQAGEPFISLCRRLRFTATQGQQLIETASWLLNRQLAADSDPVQNSTASTDPETAFVQRLQLAWKRCQQNLEAQSAGASTVLQPIEQLLSQAPSSDPSRQRWLRKFEKLSVNLRELDMIQRRFVSGETLAAISREYDLTRERVRQILGSHQFYLRSEAEVAAALQDLQRLQLKQWAQTLPEQRLPDLDQLHQQQPDLYALLCQHFNISRPPLFTERLAIAEALGLDVQAEEVDQFAAIANGTTEQRLGYGYFTEERLGRFLHWFADFLGESGLMPKQKTLPTSIRGHVGRHGGQNLCAERYGLKPQGQLTGGAEGRTFWTPARRQQLLTDAAIALGEPERMPSQLELMQFLETDPRYAGKGRPMSAIVALTQQNTDNPLSWFEVAQQYGFNYGVQSHRVTRGFVQSFIRSLGEHIESLDASEIYLLFEQQGITSKKNQLRTYDLLIDAFQAGKVTAADLRQWGEGNPSEQIETVIEKGKQLKRQGASSQEYDHFLETLPGPTPQADSSGNPVVADPSCDLPELKPVKALDALDRAAELACQGSNDEAAIAFLIAKAKSKLWHACFQDESMVAEIEAHSGNTYSQTVRAEFLAEYQSARNLPVPAGYNFRDFAGKPALPKLMQRLLAFRMLRDKRCLNLSGTGTGKTLSAILASRVCNSQVTLIVCPNSVVYTWGDVIQKAFPTVEVHCKPKDWQVRRHSDRPLYVVVNHEMVQNLYRVGIERFLVEHAVDFIVIDEIHQAKQRHAETASQRRRILSGMVRYLQSHNPELRVLGLSATPVVNSLQEGESLLSIIQGRNMNTDLEENSVASCMQLYRGFVQHGIRMVPQGRDRKNTHLLTIPADQAREPLLDLAAQKRLHPATVEGFLTPYRFETMKQCIKGKTVIFIQFVEETLAPLQQYLSSQGFSHCTYTGEYKLSSRAGYFGKDALYEFIHSDTQVLIASIGTLATGVDGLQHVCRNVIFLQLPWTSTEYEQAVGRFDREGCIFESIDIHIPLTVIQNGDEEWSWCRSKLERIRSKKDIARASVDGEIGDSKGLLTPQKAMHYWLGWLKRVEEESN